MSVIVRGMEMPKNCSQCDAEIVIDIVSGDSELSACPFIDGGFTANFRGERRHKDCPLFELKDWKDL